MSGNPVPGSTGTGVDLNADGLLWYINEHLFHPQGYALAFDRAVSADAATPGRPQFVLLYAGGEPVEFENDLRADGRSLPLLAALAMARAQENLVDIQPEVGD